MRDARRLGFNLYDFFDDAYQVNDCREPEYRHTYPTAITITTATTIATTPTTIASTPDTLLEGTRQSTTA